MANAQEVRPAGLGITGYGAYVPRLRLARSTIAEAHHWMAPNGRGRGSKAFCGWDEDALTMGVEAARAVLGEERGHIEWLTLASTTMPNVDLQHSAILATVLDLPGNLLTQDLGYSRRSGTTALIAALSGGRGQGLLVASEALLAKPASPQEMQYGAGAAAFTLGEEEAIARLVGSASVASPLVDHFRPAGAKFDYCWEERWVRDEGYDRVVPEAIGLALADAGLAIGDVHYLVFGTPSGAGGAQLAKRIGFGGTIVSPHADECGYTGAADPLMGLIGALELAGVGERVLVVGFGQGCDALIIEATERLTPYRSGQTLAAALEAGYPTYSYLRMLAFQGLYEPDWGMRGEKDVRTALTELHRSGDQIWKFNAGRCGECGTLQFPQLTYCVSCRAPAAGFAPVSLAERRGRVVTFTADYLTFSSAPPLYAGFVQFGDDARLMMEIVDAGPEGVAEGMAVKMVFRVKDRDNLRGWTRYFWKATPDLRAGEGD